jgi:hypothetical protein
MISAAGAEEGFDSEMSEIIPNGEIETAHAAFHRFKRAEPDYRSLFHLIRRGTETKCV